jgi:catechol 2,3-dioxygenase-like lactoylglutathione lyase family enzyme
VVFGSTALAVLVGLLFLVFNVVYGLLERDLSAERVADMGVPLGVIGSTVGVAAYHRRFLRQIRALRVGKQPPQPTTGIIETYGLSHISLSVNDPEVSLAFYTALFGVREYFRDENYIQALGPGEHDVLAFERRDDHGLSGGIHHFGFRLTSPDGIESVIEKAKAVGATILRHGENHPGEPYLYIADPDGYEIEIWYESHLREEPPLANGDPPVGSE